MTWDVNRQAVVCDGCRTDIALDQRLVSIILPNVGDNQHYHYETCWQTGWYTGIEPKGEWPIAEPVDADPVNNPSHYRWLPNGIEVIDITETLNFTLGNAVKYILRADHKGKPEEDIRKSIWYLTRELERRARDNAND